MGAIAMSIVHDLRNPLATIHSAAEMLTNLRLPEPQVRRIAGNMYNASLRIQEMLQDYVDAYQSRKSRRQRSNLCSLVVHAVQRISALAEAQSVVVAQDVPADLAITLDRRRIGSVLANLLANALEAMPAGGSIHISAVTEERSVVIRVRDTGPGIPMPICRRLFEPFVTAGKASGWGLGLAQARKVILDHGGEIWHESPSGGGACFALRLPAS